MRTRRLCFFCLLALLWCLPQAARAEGYRPIVSVLPLSGTGTTKEQKELRAQIQEILAADPRLQLLGPETFSKIATRYGYAPEDLFSGDGVNIVARDAKLDGVVVGKLQKLGGKYDLTLKVFDGGTGLGLLTLSFVLPRLQLRQGEREQIASQVADALSEARLSLEETPPTPAPLPEGKPEKKPNPKEVPAVRSLKGSPEEAKPDTALVGTPSGNAVENPPTPADEPAKASPKGPGTFGPLALFVGPSFSSRSANIQAIDEQRQPLAGFEPTLYRAPFYTGPSVRAEVAPLSFKSKGKEPPLLLDAAFTRSIGLQSNFNGEGIVTEAQEISGGASLRVPVGPAMLAIRGGFTQYNFGFVFNEAQVAAGVADQVAGIGLANLAYSIVSGGMSVAVPLGKPSRAVFAGASYDALLNAGQDAFVGYGLIQSSVGGHAELGVRVRFAKVLVAQLSGYGRFLRVEYQGGGVLLEGSRTITTDTLLGGGFSLGYAMP